METRIKNKIMSLILALATAVLLFAAIIPFTASADGDGPDAAKDDENEPLIYAAEAGGMSNFIRTRLYSYGQFSDVDEDQWYGSNRQGTIALAYEYGLMQGVADGIFDPAGNVTLAQAVTIAARVHSIYTAGAQDFVSGVPWYQAYVDYATDAGIINDGDFDDYTRNATRGEMAYIFARSLPQEEFAEQNTLVSLPDVRSGTYYSEYIFRFYRAGIVGGDDALGTFRPNSAITRAEAATIISRVILPEERLSGRRYSP